MRFLAEDEVLPGCSSLAESYVLGCSETAEAIIWDFEGTLAVRPGRFVGALIEAAEKVTGIAVPFETIRPMLSPAFPWHSQQLSHPFARDADGWWGNLIDRSACSLQQLGLSAAQAREAAELSRSVYLDARCWKRMDGSLQVLETLKSRGWTNLIMSNFAPELDSVVAALGFGPLVKMAFSSARVGYEKPHPEYYHHVLRELGQTKAIWMIGDTVQADIVGGRLAGLKTILVGAHAAEASHCVAGLAEIADIVGRPSRRGHNP
jgi:putative hydrolase of the HAD superfamily